MKIIHRSILRELTITFIFSVAFLNFILMTEKLLRLSRFLSDAGVSVIDMAKIISYLQPQLLLLTIPMALLLSTLFTYGRLNLDSELVILRASGMNFYGISKPVVTIGMICFLLTIAVSFYIGPKSSIKLRDEITTIISTRTPLAIEEGVFNTSFKDMVILIKEKLPDNVIRGIFIYDGRNKNEPRVLVAKEGKVFVSEDFSTNLHLKDGYIHIARETSTTELFFERYNMMLTLESTPPSRKNSELTPFELIREIGKTGGHATSLKLEFHRRLSFPLLCIILIFLGPPLALMAGKSGKLGGLALGLAVFTLYYVVLIYGENLVRARKIPHYLGAWIATIVLGVFVFIIYKRASSR
jgi:lipopolysaccharide export system permease protein